MIDVAIVGCGPTGAMLGNLLGAHGLEVAIFEKQAAIYDLPRAVHFDGETMRLFQSAGLAEEIERQTRVNPGMLFKDGKGRTLVDWSRDTGLGPMGWAESYRFHQPDLERTLRKGLERFANVTLHTKTSVDKITQDGNAVSLHINGQALQARYAVVCDGADSSLRETVTDGLEDLGFQERWMVVDLALKRDRTDLGDYSVQFCDAQAPATYVRGTGDRRRWEFRLTPDTPDAVTSEQVWTRLSRWITPKDADLERAAVYTFRSRIAKRWRKGRVFLAGDTAHQMPPFMGQGMCAGIRDAGNLAWKLACVCNGADPVLLDSFESERAPNARAFIDLSVELGRLINRTAAGDPQSPKMKSIWPGLGPGLGPRDAVAGRLAPQIARSDDLAKTGIYALLREPVGTDIPEVAGAFDWLREHGIFGAILRPDGYALASAEDKAGFAALVRTYAGLIAAIPNRRVTSKT